jgi:hypothetical protein
MEDLMSKLMKLITVASLTIATLSMITTAGDAVAAGKLGFGGPMVHAKQFAVAKTIGVAPTGDGPAGEAECKRFENAINSWADASLEALEAGDEDGTRTANRNEQALEDEATDRGCFIIY